MSTQEIRVGQIEDLPLALVSIVWGAPGAESANKIDVSASCQDFTGGSLASGIVDVEVTCSDGAADAEPSATATLGAADTPAGTILSGAGTATLVIRTDAAGNFAVGVTETAAAMRYLWIKAGGNARLWVRSAAGVLELTFV